MLRAITRYMPRAAIDLSADVAAVILAPVAALFVTRIDGREHIHPFWQWITTHDALIDIGRIDGYFQVPDTAWGRYVARVKWIWRNPAYAVAHRLGYDQRGIQTPLDGFKDPYWDTGVPNSAFWKVVNHRGQVGFLLQGQRYFYKKWCLEYQFGWKLYRRDPDKRCMLALRVAIKNYPKEV